MPRRPTQQQVFDDLLSRYEQSVRDAFLAAIDDLRTAAEVQKVIAALQAGDIQSAIEALHLDPAAFGPLQEAVRAAYIAGGQGATSTMPAALIIRFDGRNFRAENWLRTHSAELVTRIIDDQRKAIRAALVSGMEAGRNPRNVALDIVGRIDRASGKRVGGLIGLTAPQERAVEAARLELASSDPASLRAFLSRARRSKTFDRSVLKAIREETALPAETQRKALAAYTARLLQLRGEVIGQKEAFTALAQGKNEAYAQAIDSGQVPASAVTKKWRHFPNEHPRRQHIQMSGKTVRFDEVFVLPDGTRMRFPHDPEAPIEQVAGCHCAADYSIRFLDIALAA